jgi:hydrogenase/urease accessory protein HupE
MLKRTALAAAAFLATVAPAFAHPSLVAHAHPHGASPLLGLDVLIGTALIFALATGAVALARRRK